MANNSVDIEVHLKGAEAAKKGLGSIGDTAGKLAGQFDQTNSHLGEGLSQLTGNLDDLGGSFLELGDTINQVGRKGGASFAMLLPAIGGVVAAGMTLYETFQLISGAAQEAEDSQEAMAAASADLQSKLEALAEKGVIPTTQELKKFAQANLEAQLAKERQQKVFEKFDRATARSRKFAAREQALELHRTNLLAELEKVRQESGLIASQQEMGFKAAIRDADNKLLIVRRKLAEAQAEYNKQLEKALPAQQKTQKQLGEAEKQFKALEDQSAESTLARAKEAAARLDALRLADAEAKMSGVALDLQKTYIEESKEALAIRLEENKQDAEALKNIERELQAELKGFDQRKVMAERFAAQRVAIYDKQNEELEAIDKTRADQARARRKQALADQYRIRLLEIENMKLSGASQEEILEQRYQADLMMTQDSAKARLAVELRYQNQSLKLQQSKDAKAEAENQRLEDHRRNFLLESQAFDISMMEDGLNKELNALELKYRREREMKERSEEELTELTRRFNIERQAIEERSINEQIERVGELTSNYAAGFAEAAYASLVFGDSFKDSIAQTIGSLGQQATVEALISTAKGIAASVLNPAAASAHFAAAAQFGAAAVVAGGVSAAMGGGGGGGSSAPTSPTGSPQIAPTADRERATETQTVFNVNFGGAVIYDTRQAAELALADRITNLQNMHRRGAPRRR